MSWGHFVCQFLNLNFLLTEFNKYSSNNFINSIMINFIDLICSYAGIKYGYINEMNPIMNSIYNYNSLFFVLFKAVGTLLCVLLINLLYEKKKWVSITVLALNIIYIYIIFFTI